MRRFVTTLAALLLSTSLAWAGNSKALGNANYTIKSDDSLVFTSIALTASRTVTLPSASGTCIGTQQCQTPLMIVDSFGTVTSTNTIVVAPATGETINGSSSSITINAANGQLALYPLGGSNWYTTVNQASGTGTAGGSTTQVQYNNATAFGGISGWTTDGANLLTGGAGTTVTSGNVKVINGGFIYPSANATTAIRIGQADGTTAFVTFDSTNKRVGINKTPGAYDFDVNGGINADLGANVGSTVGYSWASRAIMFSPADGIIRLTNAAANNFTRLQLGGTTSSFPSISRSSAAIAFLLADASADAAITAAGGSFSGLITNTGITSDATHTTGTVCQDTTTHVYYTGSGAAGICLGTSGRQFKRDLAPMTAGLAEITKLPLHNYRYKEGHGDNGVRVQYGLIAQDVARILPDLAGYDASGEVINYDWGAMVFVSMRAIQELESRVKTLEGRTQ